MSQQMSDFTDIPQEFLDQMDAALTGKAIRLPFNVAYFYWRNGSKSIPAALGVSHFGGWLTDKDTFELYLTNQGIDTVPAYFTPIEVTSKDGKLLPSYSTRKLAMALIGRRMRWVPSLFGGSNRSHLQALAYMAITEKQKEAIKIVPIGPAVLTCKGMISQAFVQQLITFEQATAAARAALSKTQGMKRILPAWLFYAFLGTFGKEAKIEMVGDKQKSPVTFPEIYLPEQINETHLQDWYVGGETVAIMAEKRQQAETWLGAWKTQAKESPSGDGKSGGEQVPSEPEAPPFFDDTPF